MNDFDRFLEIELQRMLDPVVDLPAPSRNARRKRVGTPLVAVVTGPLEMAAEAIAVPVEPAAVPVPVTSV